MQTTFATTRALVRAGNSADDLTRAVRSGALIRPRQGLYCAPSEPPELVRAARVGGVATAATGARALGLWTPPDDRLHVFVPANAARLRDPDTGGARTFRDDLCVHWGHRVRAAGRVTPPVAPILIVLEHSLECLRAEYALALLDSALHLRFVSSRDLVALAATLPAYLAALVELADGLSESGIETIARYRLRLAGLHVDVQVVIDGVGRVDLLVEGRVIVELDGKAFHEGDAFQRDRRRDTAATIARYRALRFSFAQVIYDWPSVEAAVFAALAA
jgi:very-short-patch-repair endonuclease